MLIRIGLNGARRDPATGLYMPGNGYRHYHPGLMRFQSRDSLSPFGEGARMLTPTAWVTRLTGMTPAGMPAQE